MESAHRSASSVSSVVFISATCLVLNCLVFLPPADQSAVAASSPAPRYEKLARQLGLFDATMVVMGGIVGSGIFINPYVVAQRVHTPVLIMAAWVAGGVVALLGAFIYAELAGRMPRVGGQYAYLREAYHPAVGFLYGWVLLLVIQCGGMAAVTITFARYFLELTGWKISETVVGAVTLLLLTVINCAGVKLGSRVQSALMVLRILAIALLIVAGLWRVRAPHSLGHPVATLIALGIAISTLGFLSQAILTAPRVYFAMADDKLFFPAVAYVSPRTRVPVVAIILQSAWTMVIAISGRYEQILNYVVAMDFLFFGLTATCLFVFRRRERRLQPEQAAGYRVPGHPLTTAVFIAACWLVVANTIYRYPENSLIGMAILLLGLPAYALWSIRQKRMVTA